MENHIPSFFKGHFLIALPSLVDPNFKQSVTCVAEHTPEGALGIVISRRHPDIGFKMILDGLEIEHAAEVVSVQVHSGGPVHTSELFVLHGEPLQAFGGIQINESLALSNSLEILQAIASGQGPKNFMIALGCAGWAPGQLDWELSQNAWLTVPCSDDIIFHTPVEGRWEHALKKLGIDPTLLTATSGHA